MSNYWMPSKWYCLFPSVESCSCRTTILGLYWMNHGTGSTPSSFVSLPATIRFYLFLSQSTVAQPVIPFPDGLRSIAGNPSNKIPPYYANFVCQIGNNQSDFLLGSSFNFPRDCPGGMKTNLFFPQCWDGKNLWLPNTAHLSTAVGNSIKNGPCPWSHPIKLPTLMLEYTWHPEQYFPRVPLAGNLVWANGDTTGYGIHGDFMNA